MKKSTYLLNIICEKNIEGVWGKQGENNRRFSFNEFCNLYIKMDNWKTRNSIKYMLRKKQV